MSQQNIDVSLDADWNHLFIDGEWESPDRDPIDVSNPATGETIATIPAATETDVDRAYDAAVTAQPAWAETPPQERAQVVQRAIGLIHEHEDELVQTVVAETGGTLLKAGLEVGQLTPGIMAEAASFPLRSQGTTADSVISGKENVVVREPKGVVGIITPWNFPVNLSMRAIAPAIALGNTVVLKPSEETPIAGGFLHARLFEAAGLPPGVLNVVSGYGAEAGARVAEHPDLDVLSFTGSTEVGRKVAQAAARNLALPTLELGGNNAHVVLEDADLDLAVDAGTFGSFVHQGQVCISINRHLVHENLYDEYVERLASRAAGLTVGDPSDPATDVGPVINEAQRDKMVRYVEDSVAAGATIEAGGGYDGLFVEPTVLSGMTNDMAAACNEHFGPIVPVIPFGDDEEAVALANDSDYGLSGSVHSTDVERARSVARRMETGMVHVNDQPINDEPHVPFGGVKGSGLGRYNGESILREFTREKWISIQHEPREYPL